MKKINFEPVANVAKDICKIVGYGTAMMLPYAIKEMILREVNNKPVGYSDAVKVIMNSSMLSSYKHEAMTALKPEGGNDYYKAVIYVVNSSMLGSDKVKMIQDLAK